MKIVIVADGDVDADALRRVVSDPEGERPLVIAADGGALRADAAGVLPDLVIGDGDSVSADDVEHLRARGVEVRIVATEKDESDTELCIREAVARGADTIRLFGALGGTRPEHALANIALLALPSLQGRDVTLEHGASSIRLVGRPDGDAAMEFAGRPGDYLSLQPLPPGAQGVTTQGLRYPLAAESLPYGPSRGLSNEFQGDRAVVSVEAGRMLVTLTRHGGHGR